VPCTVPFHFASCHTPSARRSSPLPRRTAVKAPGPPDSPPLRGNQRRLPPARGELPPGNFCASIPLRPLSHQTKSERLQLSRRRMGFAAILWATRAESATRPSIFSRDGLSPAHNALAPVALAPQAQGGRGPERSAFSREEGRSPGGDSFYIEIRDMGPSRSTIRHVRNIAAVTGGKARPSRQTINEENAHEGRPQSSRYA
jgi:hypothetical protein